MTKVQKLANKTNQNLGKKSKKFDKLKAKEGKIPQSAASKMAINQKKKNNIPMKPSGIKGKVAFPKVNKKEAKVQNGGGLGGTPSPKKLSKNEQKKRKLSENENSFSEKVQITEDKNGSPEKGNVIKTKNKKINPPADSDEEIQPTEDSDEENLPTADSDDDSDDENEPTTSDKKNRSKRGVTIFVGNLPTNIKREKLYKTFSKYGKVLSIRFRTSKGKRFFKAKPGALTPNLIAFIDYDTTENATKSLQLNGTKIDENILRVNLQNAVKKKTNNFDAKRTVFIGNLKYSATDQMVHDTFKCCGELDYVRGLQTYRGGNGTAFVCFKDPSSVDLALKLNNTVVCGREIRVERYMVNKLGAKAARKPDANKKTAPTGKDRRLQDKNKNAKGNTMSSPKVFAGVKTNKNKKQKKKPGLKGEKLLAKKIAPRDTVQETV